MSIRSKKKNGFYSEEELFSTESQSTYKGEYLDAIAFPIGGIGTGCISINGQGGLQDWEIFNRPNKKSVLPHSFFSLWAKAGNLEPVTRVLQGPPPKPYAGPFGIMRETAAGLPHMKNCKFKGEYPFACVHLNDSKMPVTVDIEAYNPLIPLNDKDSSIPTAIFLFHIKNATDKETSATLAANLFNPIGYSEHLGGNINTYVEKKGVKGLVFSSNKYSLDSPRFGNMALTTTWDQVIHQCYWLRPSYSTGYFSSYKAFWDEFSGNGQLSEREYGPSEDGKSDVGSIGLKVLLEPGQEATLPIVISWYFPNFEKYWGCEGKDCKRPVWKNYYAQLFDDALDIATYVAAEEERLYQETKVFHDTLFNSTLPWYVVDAISSQASILKTPTCLRLEDGTFYGFEGCSSSDGCCEGSCTHVWNYSQTLAFLFPKLERSMRDADYKYNLLEDGKMCFRIPLPLSSPSEYDFYAAADGQMGGILKVYRDWKLSGDDQWLKNIWPKAQKALEYAWIEWDKDKDGVMEGVQHNTYDIEFHGPNSMMGSFYLGALKAGEEIACFLGETGKAKEYKMIFDKGKARMDSELFNDEFYIQKYDERAVLHNQYGKGCLSDQLIGQWFSSMVGLGYLFEQDHVGKTLQSIFTYNWRTDFFEHANCERIYAINDDKGLLLCSWPHGGRPDFPFIYSDEVWCGIEYQVASHLIYEGFIEEGLSIVKGLRERYDGCRRNPWDEFECGHHYARSMASWSLLTALSGFKFDMSRKSLGFSPRISQENFSCFWSVDSGWGCFSQSLNEDKWICVLEVKHGYLVIKELGVDVSSQAKLKSAYVNGDKTSAKVVLDERRKVVHFEENITLNCGDVMKVFFSI